MSESATRFAIAPDVAALEQIDRQLAFFPVRNEDPQRLASAQISEFNVRGYLSGIRIFPDAEITGIRRQFDTLLQQVLAEGGDSYSISSAHLTHAAAYDLLADDRIVDHVADILGPDVVGWGCHYFCKLPHDGKRVDWHQDATYWPLTPSRTVTVWLAIDDADSGNACMRFVPGSHLSGPLPFEVAGDESTVLNQRVRDLDEFAPAVDNELRAGEISLHSDLLLHGSEANDSDRRRCGLTLRYCAAEIRAHLDWHLKGVVLRGSDPAGHWADPPRPSG